MKVTVEPNVLRAFAQLHEGSQFQSEELHCRVVTAMTDEWHPIEGSFWIEVYGVPLDPDWHRDMQETYGPGPHEVVFWRNCIPAQDPAVAVRMLRNGIRRELSRTSREYGATRDIAASAGITESDGLEEV